MKNKLALILMFLVFISGLFIGIVGERYDNKPTVDPVQYEGLWLNNFNEEDKNEITKSKDINGEWVCVNVKDMDYSRAVEVCNHEVGHEIFAEVCEKDINKCLEVLNHEK